MIEEIQFKRFSKDKQEQIKQFVAYAQFMGLSGKDIRSIGDKLDRMRKADEKRTNLQIIDTHFQCLAIGDDAKARGKALEENLDERFKLKTANGTYNFQRDYGNWKVTSLTTKKIMSLRCSVFEYELGQTYWGRTYRYSLLLDIYYGKVKLDF